MGLPLRDYRPLTAEESAKIRSQSRRPLGVGCAAIGLFPVVFLAIIGAMAGLETYGKAESPRLGVMGFLLVACPAVVYLRAKETLQRGKRLRRDLKCGYVKRYQGTMRALRDAEQADAPGKGLRLATDAPRQYFLGAYRCAFNP